MGYQNFFATRLFVDAGSSDTTLTLETPPTQTSGHLVLEARNPTQREIISYTNVSGNDITGVTRGVGGTTATTHLKNSLVEMNLIAEDLIAALAAATDVEDRFDDIFNDFIASGLVVTDDTGLTADVSAGVAYINGIRLVHAGEANHAFTASRDTYVDLGDNGVLDYNAVTNGAAAPALAASHIRIAKVVTNATDTTSVWNYPNPGYLPTDNGWKDFPATLSNITCLGNHSYSATTSVDMSNTVFAGNRLRFIRSVQAPTYMGGLFNGSSHYFTKTTPTSTLSTVTNNFTIMAWVKPTTYNAGYICGRGDATPNNLLTLKMELGGQISVAVNNAGGANYRVLTTAQAIPLNKKTHIAATWTSGTVVIYIDGVSVPLIAAILGGTSPTVAGTGGDFSIGRPGAWANSYWNGYISNVAVFDAVLTAATIRSYMSQTLTGSETNCIGAWSLNNTAVNQQAAGTNDLTATGGVGYTSDSPYSMGADLANGYLDGAVEFGIVSLVNTTTIYFQTPEGSMVPTSGGLAAIAYSGEKTPYGFPAEPSRWRVGCHIGALIHTGSLASTAIGNFGLLRLDVPIGSWNLGFAVSAQQNPASGNNSAYTFALSTSSSSISDIELARTVGIASGTTVSSFSCAMHVSKLVTLAAATPYYIISRNGLGVNGNSYLSVLGSSVVSQDMLFAENAYL